MATKLTGVDIIMAAGSNTLLADANDRLRAGDVAVGTYPFLATDFAGKTVPVINTDGNYKYVGRLVVDFDADGNLIPSSIDSAISGVYAADAQGLNDVWGSNVANAYAVGTRGYQVKLLTDAIGNVINTKEGNLFGKTAVFLEGRRNFVRTEETNLGNLSAEANLWMAKFYDPTTVISFKNGGGIRSAIGNVVAVGDNVTLTPPSANTAAGKQVGDISQLDIENSLRFNNQLSLVTLTAAGLRSILEHAVAGTTATATPGQFAQIAGVRYSYNFSNAVGSRILNAVVTDANGNAIDTLVANGVTLGNLSRTFRVVTLNFLAGGGDSYPFVALSSNRVDLNTLTEVGPAMATFANAGSEQDAFSEYMKSQFSTTAYGVSETAMANDCRIQRVPARTDDVLPTAAGTNGNISVTIGGTVTSSQLFAALGGSPVAGGTWNPTPAGVGVYTYTVMSPTCSGLDTATVSVSETIPTTMTFCQGAKISDVIGVANLNFYTTATSTTTLATTTALTARTYFVTQTVNGQESLVRTPVVVTINALPTEIPTTITGTVTSTTTTTGFENAITSVGKFVGTMNTVSYRTGTFAGSGLSYLWKVPMGVSIVGQAANVREVIQTGANANVLNVNYNNIASGVGTIGLISVQAVNANSCAGPLRSINISKALPIAPSAIRMTNAATPLPVSGIPVSLTTFAPFMGTNTELTLTAIPSATATSYVWELPTGVVVTNGSATTVSGVTSSTSNIITVNFSGVTAANTFNYLTTATVPVSTNNLRIGVKANNGVGMSTTNNTALTNSSALFLPNSTSTARLLTLTAVKPTAPTLRMTNNAVSSTVSVSDISTFIGTTMQLTLTASTVATASSYSWEIPSAVTVVAGSNLSSNTINVSFENVPTGTTSLYLGVKAVNGLGSSVVNNATLTPATTSEARLIKVTAKAPSTVSVVSGSLAICATAASSVTYLIPTLALGATEYNITAPTSTTITGSLNNMITIPATGGATFTVNYPSGFVANTSTSIQNISVQSENGFGVSTTNRVLRLTNVGAICGSSSRNSIAIFKAFDVTAYPIPTNDIFTLNVESSSKQAVSVQVYDMTGRLVETLNSKSNSIQIGNNYSTGVYNVVVSQGNDSKTLRVIKN